MYSVNWHLNHFRALSRSWQRRGFHCVSFCRCDALGVSSLQHSDINSVVNKIYITCVVISCCFCSIWYSLLLLHLDFIRDDWYMTLSTLMTDIILSQISWYMFSLMRRHYKCFLRPEQELGPFNSKWCDYLVCPAEDLSLIATKWSVYCSVPTHVAYHNFLIS